VAQQFDIGRQVAAHGLMPILEPEVTISITDKAEAEAILQEEILKALEGVAGSGHAEVVACRPWSISISRWSSIRRC
jgi:fructose-bisphosphate aldolase class 1